MTYPPQPGAPGSPQGWNQPPGWGQHPQPGQGPQPGGQYPAGYAGPPQPSGAGDGQDFWRHVAAGGPQRKPPRKRRTGLILGIAGGAAVVVLGAVLGAVWALGSGDVQAGDCVSLQGEYGGAVSETDCGTPDSDYEVLRVLDGRDPKGCSGSFYNVHEETTYCMALDVVVGDCLSAYREEKGFLPVSRECGEPNAQQVTKVADRSDADNVCAEREGRYWFSNPPRTVCFGPAQGG